VGYQNVFGTPLVIELLLGVLWGAELLLVYREISKYYLERRFILSCCLECCGVLRFYLMYGEVLKLLFCVPWDIKMLFGAPFVIEICLVCCGVTELLFSVRCVIQLMFSVPWDKKPKFSVPWDIKVLFVVELDVKFLLVVQVWRFLEQFLWMSVNRHEFW